MSWIVDPAQGRRGRTMLRPMRLVPVRFSLKGDPAAAKVERWRRSSVSTRGRREAVRNGPSKAIEEVIQALEAGQAGDAADAVGRLEASVRQNGKADGVVLSRMWKPLKRLLHRRGYYVSTSGETAGSLKEIREVGQGFDLYDLAVAIARFDMAVTGCLKLVSKRLFPELQTFAPRCDCWKHPFKVR